MKKVISTIACALTSFLVFVIGLAFVFIEGRLLFSGELNTYAIPWFAVFSTIVKLLLAITAMVIAIIPWFAKRTKYGSGLRTFAYVALYALVPFAVIFALSINMGSSRALFLLLQILIFLVMPVLHSLASTFYLIGE